jgi:HEAT repeat protein
LFPESAKDEDLRTRTLAATALAAIDPDEVKKVIPTLTDLLRAEDDLCREHAAEALGNIGHAAAISVPALTALLNDKDKRVRNAAAEALKKITK